MTAGPGPLPTDEILDRLRSHAARHLERSFVPYSNRASAATLLLSDGTVVPGVRVESASFSLAIPAALNAVTTAVAAGRHDFAALVVAGPDAAHTAHYLAGLPGSWRSQGDDAWMAAAVLPSPGLLLNPFETPAESVVDAARAASQRAWTPESDFPVGAVVVSSDGRWVPGVNVEHPDWTCILCAERNALGTAVTYGALPVARIGLSCPRDPSGSPCGACRQLIVELAGQASVWIDRGDGAHAAHPAADLLPFAFTGKALGR